MKKAEDLNNLEIWKRDNCSRMFDAVQHKLMENFGLLDSVELKKQESDVLSDFEMWFIMSSLPNLYFPTATKDGNLVANNWTKLYSSTEHGISVTRFQANVFDYRGPTVGVFRFRDGSLFVLAREDEWKDSSKPYTSTSTILIKLFPDYVRIESPSIYCNFKLRNSPLKLSFDSYGTISKDMDNLIDVEVT
uniref:TLDc domain-containing protein n=1 Tax=Syphacia muris TaxID=451379 RepID=A0A0N5AJZ1_9BILA